MTGDLGTLEAANERFYDALEAGDLDAMTGLWSDGDDAWCVHPGAELIVGAARVRRSWAAVFASGQQLQMIVTDVRCRLVAGAGVVTCTENVLTGLGGGQLGAARSLATNVFVAVDGAWRLVGHHASPVLRGVG